MFLIHMLKEPRKYSKKSNEERCEGKLVVNIS